MAEVPTAPLGELLCGVHPVDTGKRCIVVLPLVFGDAINRSFDALIELYRLFGLAETPPPW